MLKSFLFLCLIFYAFGSNCQPKEDNTIYTYVDEEAAFRGGVEQMSRFISKKFRYPSKAIEENIEGRVIIRFVINKRGKVTNVEIEKGLPSCPECEEEAIRIIKSMPKWKPAETNGRKVNCYFRLPINFVLE
ncbi:MAG: hypothetical protein RIT43_407 [Bacteroidota bacterium]|jgi:protein TonB